MELGGLTLHDYKDGYYVLIHVYLLNYFFPQMLTRLWSLFIERYVQPSYYTTSKCYLDNNGLDRLGKKQMK